MSSFNNLFNRMEALNEDFNPEGSKSLTNTPDAFTGLRGKMKLAGMKATSRDAMLYIARVLSRTDIITSAEHDHTIKGQHVDRWNKLFAILKDKSEEINERSDEIVEFMKKDLNIFTDEIGKNRGKADGEGRSELYAAQAEMIKSEIDNIEAGKEADDGLEDIMGFVRDTLKDISMMKADDDTPETGPVAATVDGIMANLRKEARNDPDSIPPYVIDDLQEFLYDGPPENPTNKIKRLDQYKSFVKQLYDFSKKDQYYDKPVAYFMQSIKTLEDNIAKNVAEVEDGEHGELEIDEIDPTLDPRAAVEALNDARLEAEGEAAADERLRATDPAESNEVSIKQEVLNACKERAEEKYQGLKSAGMAQACQEMYEEYHQMYNAYGEEGDQEKAERAREKEDIALSLQKYYETQSKFEARENEEELTIESAYNTMYIKAPVIDENGKTSQDCSAQQYLTEAAEQEIEEAGLYTEGYLVEQKTTDSYIKSKPAQGQTFKERYKPKTSYQLEELRRYGL